MVSPRYSYPDLINATPLKLNVFPRVTSIMPTADRRAFVPRAIAQFLAQDYTNSELLIVDDGIDRIGDLVPDDPRVRYLPLERRMVLGAKRNLACEQARGDVI